MQEIKAVKKTFNKMHIHKTIGAGGFDYKDQEKAQKLAILINEGIVMEVPAIAFNRSPIRKERETQEAFRRSMKNMKRAMKAYYNFGPGTMVMINKETMVVV